MKVRCAELRDVYGVLHTLLPLDETLVLCDLSRSSPRAPVENCFPDPVS